MNFWKRPKFILWVLGLGLWITVILQNLEPTQVDFLLWSFPTVPKLALIVISMAAGAVFVSIASWEIRSIRRRKREASSAFEVPPPTVH